ncbi:isoprenoid synthase domain-containing protein [Fusarium venenatum]|uniref:isoprenoid synthase domain-containing protein n=1 Tax=Fusarium venenatum TaxID=56646 RepID=UPI001D7F4B65|nr:isoprenoid synthase domain-containing protein [Fusarium venenatum]
MGISSSTLSWKYRGTPSYKRHLCQQISPSTDSRDLKSFIKPLITSFTTELEYSPVAPTNNDALWKAMCLYANGTGVSYDEGTHSGTCFKIGFTYPVVSDTNATGQVCFPHHPVEVQTYIGIYSWLGLLLDDEAVTHPDDFEMFHQRFCAGEKQPIPLLQGWADLMTLVFEHWDPLVANFIITASLNFLNANALQAREDFTHIERTKAGRSWAWFIREKDGVGEAYAWFTFPKALCGDKSRFMEVIPDLSMWIGLTNDILSFWKEEQAGEKHNYIHTRGWYDDKDTWSTFEDIVDDVRLKTRNTIYWDTLPFTNSTRGIGYGRSAWESEPPL